MGVTLFGALCCAQPSFGQAATQNQAEPPPTKPKVIVPGSSSSTIESITEEYNQQLLELERRRLERLARLAASQPPAEANKTYEHVFRLVVGNNLFLEAEPIARRVLKTAGISPSVRFLAQSVNVIAAADRGAYDESLADLRNSIGGPTVPNQAGTRAPLLDTSALLILCEAYYQRLIQADQIQPARQAFRLIFQDAQNPAVKSYCAGRLNRLDMVGQPAPQIQGTDLDGKPVSLADLKGNAVLVVFWASWCLPSAAEVEWLNEVNNTYRNQGFRILGINLDTASSGAPSLESVLPNVRRFVLDHNVHWPNLVNGAGAHDYAKAYAITDIPANVLIGRDGTVFHLDLMRKNLASVIARAVAR
jgi:thiol-disulfide isomerase/thioredoxin